MKRPKTPISRPSSVRQSFSSHPTKHTGILGLTKRHVSESAHKLPPHAAPSAVGNSHGLKLETEEHVCFSFIIIQVFICSRQNF